MARVKDDRSREGSPRSFTAHCSNAGTHRSDFVTQAASFEEAAMAFAERWTGPEGECRVIVTDRETGKRHGFCLPVGHGGHAAGKG